LLSATVVAPQGDSTNNRGKNQGENTMCQIFAGQKPETYEYETRSLRLNGQSTSIRLEKSFWTVLGEIAAAEDLSVPQFISKLHSEVLQLHGEARNFTSLLRCACLIHMDRAATETVSTRFAAE
jgi:predicted DNA-binding ribbon-helix-helix protein